MELPRFSGHCAIRLPLTRRSNGTTKCTISDEISREARRAHRAGRSVSEICEEFEPCEQTVYRWIRQADIDDGKRDDGPTTDEKDELSELKRELRRVLRYGDAKEELPDLPEAEWRERKTTS